MSRTSNNIINIASLCMIIIMKIVFVHIDLQ